MRVVRPEGDAVSNDEARMFIDGVSVTKTMTQDGDVYLEVSRSDDLSLWEAIGMCMFALDYLRACLMQPDDEEEGED